MLAPCCSCPRQRCEITCFTGTKVQILTEVLYARAMLLPSPEVRNYVLYWYKSTNTNGGAVCSRHAAPSLARGASVFVLLYQ
jgi:hypothetical protein